MHSGHYSDNLCQKLPGDEFPLTLMVILRNSSVEVKRKFRVVQCSISAKKVACTCACNFKKLHAHNLVYMHLMWMMKYMHKIYVVPQGVVIPGDIPASISSLRRAPLMSQVIPHHMHCKIKTQHFHHAEAEQIHPYFYLH